MSPTGVLQALALVAGILACALALLVLRASPRAATSRILAAILFLEGALQLATALPDGASPRVQLAADAGFALGILHLPWLYLLFLSRLDTPLAQPLRRGRVAIVGVLLVYAAIFPVALLHRGDEPPAWLIPFFLAAFLALGLASLYGFFVAVSTYRRAAPGTLARRRAHAYAVAFGARDVLVVIGIVAFFVEEAITRNSGVHVPAATIVAASTVIFVMVLAYGILRAQVLDIEARLRWTISRGAVAATFLAAYIVASQAATLLVAPRWGPAAGVLAAGLLVLALMPLQRVADRLAARAVPDAARSTATLELRRLEIYEAALAELAPDGQPRDAGSARYLASLRERLGLTEMDHAVLARHLRAAPATQPAPAPGHLLLDRFRVERELGEGGEGRAFLAEDLQLQREVVLKLVASSARALREARALASMRHPNVATVHDVVALGDEALLVIEHVEAGSLKARLARGPLQEAAWWRVARELLDALEAVHARGIVHGDVKPSNVLLTREGGVKLADFGIARSAAADATRTAGTVEGTHRYMSPEQARGAPASPRSDLYAAALTLAEARAGDAARVAAEGPLAPWFARALQPSPERRFASAREMRDALEGYRS